MRRYQDFGVCPILMILRLSLSQCWNRESPTAYDDSVVGYFRLSSKALYILEIGAILVIFNRQSCESSGNFWLPWLERFATMLARRDQILHAFYAANLCRKYCQKAYIMFTDKKGEIANFPIKSLCIVDGVVICKLVVITPPPQKKISTSER